MLQKIKTLEPNYLKEFQCIADRCEDSCCGGWTIGIDKKTFKKYKKNKEYKKNISKNNSSLNDYDYGVMKTDENGNCVFLNSEALCSIVLSSGPEELCKTCKNYPRHFSIYGDRNHQEISLSTSCPEAARKVILMDEKISFNMDESNYSKFDIASFSVPLNIKDIRFYSWDIRYTVIEILQNNSYSLNEKLTLIGLLCRDVDEAYTNDNLHLIENVLNKYKKVLESRISMNLLDEYSDKNFSIIKKIIESRSTNHKKYNELIKNFENQLVKNKNLNEYTELRRNLINTVYKEFITRKPYALENYLVNYVFRNNFPVNGLTLTDSFYILCAHFGLIKNLLLALGAKHGEINDEHAVDVIYSVGRVMEHNKVFFDLLISDVKTNGENSIAHAVILLG